MGKDYLRDGERRAFGLGSRGPIRFSADGAVLPDILEAYWRCGFYVFEGVPEFFGHDTRPFDQSARFHVSPTRSLPKE